MRDTDADWNVIAHENPYWGVLSEEKYKGSTLHEASKTEFFASGERYVANLLGLINNQLSGLARYEEALDFGCGVGRLAIPLARRFRNVVAVDIANDMLRLTANHAEEFSLSNVEPVESSLALAFADRRFDLINSFIVLQHIPPETGMSIIRRLVEMTKVGGVCSLQVTYARSRKLFVHETNSSEFYRRDGRFLMDLGPQRAKYPLGTITMYDYDLNDLMPLFGQYAGHPMIALPTNDDGHLGAHFIFKRAR